MRTRSLVVAVVAWMSVVAVASGVTWLVIDSAGQDLLAVDTPAVSSLGPSPEASRTRVPRPEPSPAHSSAAATPRSAGPALSSAPAAVPDPTPTAPTSTTPPPVPSSEDGDGPPRPASHSDAWTGAQGTVAVTCTGSRITGRSVTPNDGWQAEVEGSGTGEVEVKFESGERETQVKVRCASGVPRFQVEQD